MSINPFLPSAEALEAHERMPQGRVHVIEDDPITPEERADIEKYRARLEREARLRARRLDGRP